MARNRQTFQLEDADRLDTQKFFGEAFEPFVRVSVYERSGASPVVAFKIDQDSALAWLRFTRCIQRAVAALNVECASRKERAAREVDPCTAL